MVEIVKAGGWLMAPIVLCAIMAMGIVFERYWTLQEKRVIPEDLTSKHVTDLITPDEIGTTALSWRLEQTIKRFQSPLGINTPNSPEIQLLHQVVDLLNDWVVIKDREHRYLEVSESFAQSVGMSKDRIIGAGPSGMTWPPTRPVPPP